MPLVNNYSPGPIRRGNRNVSMFTKYANEQVFPYGAPIISIPDQLMFRAFSDIKEVPSQDVVAIIQTAITGCQKKLRDHGLYGINSLLAINVALEVVANIRSFSEVVRIQDAPYSMGKEFGLNWAKMASNSLLLYAVEWQSTNEQLKQHFDFYAECAARGEMDDDNKRVTPPYQEDEFKNRDKNFAAYFQSIIERYPLFQGYADDATDPGVSRDGYSVNGMPVSAFRVFEDGWTVAVREYVKQTP